MGKPRRVHYGVPKDDETFCGRAIIGSSIITTELDNVTCGMCKREVARVDMWLFGVINPPPGTIRILNPGPSLQYTFAKIERRAELARRN